MLLGPNMSQITLTAEQLEQVATGGGAVEIRNATGTVLGSLELDLAAIAIAVSKQRLASDHIRIPGDRVGGHLKALQEEWDRLGGFDRDYMQSLLAQLQAQDAR